VLQKREELTMHVKLIALALVAATASPALAEPVLPFAPFLLLSAQRQPDTTTSNLRTRTDSRDSLEMDSVRDVRPLGRPAILLQPVRAAGVSPKIVRMPWSTGVFQ
jgi:hypothetical protein